jgi:hypothetical protein
MSQQSQPTSYTVWERLEPITRNYDLTEALRAEIRDPAWLLTRQWQLGEFEGNDAGSPVFASLEYVHETMSSVSLPGGTEDIPYDPASDPPLETVVERERVATDANDGPNDRIRVEAGMHFLARFREQLREADADSNSTLPVPVDFPTAFRLDMSDENLDAAARRFQRIAGEHQSLDGYEIYAALDEHVPGIGTDALDWTNAATDRLPRPEGRSGQPDDPFKTAASAYYEWYRDLYEEPESNTGEAWNEDRLEYEFSATTTTAPDPDDSGAETTFDVTEYDGRQLDWDDFTVAAGTGGTASSSRSVTRTPTRMRFRGMPNPRYWELEDANVDLSALSAAPADLSWMTMVEIALVAGTSWFLIPLRAPYGTLTRITDFTVRDTFGHETTIESETPTDWSERPNVPDEKGWNMFMFDLPNRDEPGVLLPPVLGSSLQSPPVEQVRFTRDESANLVFAIETLAEGPLGDPLERREFDRPRLEVLSISPASNPATDSITLRNAGDDDLDMDKWALEIDVAADGFQFEGQTFAAGTTVELHQFRDVTLGPGDSLELVSGGSPALDTATRRHIGATVSIWGQGPKLETYRVCRPSEYESENENGADSMDTVLAAPVGLTSESSLPRYVLASDVPNHWFPLKPVDTGTDEYRLKVALLLDADTIADTVHKVPAPMGRVLTPEMSVYDEEITREGTQVGRRYHLASDPAGRTHLWSGRTVSVGSGQESSGLRFDFIEEPDVGTTSSSGDENGESG